MARAVGSNAILKFCEEATWGTTPGSPAKVFGLNLRSETLSSTRNLFQSETLNQFRSVAGLGEGNKAVAGGIVTDLFPEGLEILMKHLLGNPTVATTGSGPYTHVMEGAAGYLPGLTIEKGFPAINQYFLYKGCRVNSMNITLVQEGFHDVSVDFVGKSETLAGSSGITGVAVYGTKNGFTGYQCVVSSDFGGSWADLSNVVSGSIVINNSVETDGYVLGSGERASAEYGKREISGDFSVFFEDASLYNVYANGTECGLKFTFSNGTDQIIFEFPVCKVGGTSPQIASAGGLNMALTYQARRSEALGYDVKVTIINSKSAF